LVGKAREEGCENSFFKQGIPGTLLPKDAEVPAGHAPGSLWELVL